MYSKESEKSFAFSWKTADGYISILPHFVDSQKMHSSLSKIATFNKPHKHEWRKIFDFYVKRLCFNAFEQEILL